MYDLKEHIASSFPLREKYTDCCGVERSFEISVRSLPVGYVVEARELSNGEYGYEFSQSAEAHPFDALGSIRKKIRRALSQRYINRSRGEMSMASDQLEGRITHLGLVIDGELIPWINLQRLLATYEGFPVKITVEE